MHAFLTDAPEFWWASSTPNKDNDDAPRMIALTKGRREEILERKKDAVKLLNSGAFSYNFDRMREDHVADCTCFGCHFIKEMIRSEAMLEFCKSVTGDDALGGYPPPTILFAVQIREFPRTPLR